MSYTSNIQMIETLGQRLGISTPSTFSKAEELHRRLSIRGVKGLTSTAEVVICLQLAATITGETYDKALCPKLSGLSASMQRSQSQALGQMLGVSQHITIHDLAITHSALPAEELAKEALDQYIQQAYGIDASLPVYQAAALAGACKPLRIKLDKRKIYESSSAQKRVFDTLVEKLAEMAKEINKEKKKKDRATRSRSKRTKSLMDMIEDNIVEAAAEEELKRKQHEEAASATASKRAKCDQNEDDEEYEEWKRKIMLEAQKADHSE
uniref:Origin recognition complex subunit 6-like n=1 Tax=Hirondellea gigas TaxID=1518452 RepID=A0A2P2I223_9CRUS